MLPELPIVLEPGRSLLERLGLKPTRPPLGIAAALNQPAALEHAEVFRNRRETHFERRREVRHGGFAPSEAVQDRSTSGISESGERLAESIGHGAGYLTNWLNKNSDASSGGPRFFVKVRPVAGCVGHLNEREKNFRR